MLGATKEEIKRREKIIQEEYGEIIRHLNPELDNVDWKKCPCCGLSTFTYEPKLEENRCYNEACRFSDKVGIAPDVPMSFLEHCLSAAKSPVRKKIIEEVINKTKEADERYYRKSKYCLD
ncbi:hypothetical protein JW949_02625 [Candidatus Woesearchaeota archaeon]|nr:hypothetical protein [Candidatus Woesearchaeota archaeon]